MKKYLADYHVHTEFSDDSVCPMEEMVQKGIVIGLERDSSALINTVKSEVNGVNIRL